MDQRTIPEIEAAPNDDLIFNAMLGLTREAKVCLTKTVWKDGIDIDEPNAGCKRFVGQITEPYRVRLALAESQAAQLSKEIAFRDFEQARVSDIALNYGSYDEIQKALGTEITMHAAWRKRAEESEKEAAELRDEVERLKSYQANYEHATKIEREEMQAALERQQRAVTDEERVKIIFPEAECVGPMRNGKPHSDGGYVIFARPVDSGPLAAGPSKLFAWSNAWEKLASRSREQEPG